MSDKEQYILSHHVQTYMYILHSPTPLFITLCCMYVFLHLSGEEHTGCHSRQEEAVSLWGDRNWSSAHCGSLYHHEPRICWQDRTARESQSSLQVRQTIVRLLYIWPPPLCCIQSHRLSIFLPPPCPFSLLSHSPFHPSTPPPLFSTLLHHPPTSSTILQPPPPSSTMSRPCAMVVPDFELIAEIMLVAEGFLEARLLARKFLTLYTLCKVQCVYNHSFARKMQHKPLFNTIFRQESIESVC